VYPAVDSRVLHNVPIEIMRAADRVTAPVPREALVGIEQLVPLLDGRLVPYVNLDNAASTPAFRSVVDAVDEFLPFYSGVHRGTGYKSRVSTTAFERARDIVGEFVGADAERDVVVFTKNTTEAINRLTRSLVADENAVVLTTMLEHHSNDLPWRGRFRTVHIGVRPDGTLDADDLDRRLAEHAGHIALLAVCGASNVTGIVQPVHELAEKVHAVGGRIVVDAAQLAPHRRIDMRPHDDPGHLDFVAMSGHKLYAPYGTGALVGARSAFGEMPDHVGGGTVSTVTIDTIAWADLPDREEAGSPNVVGAVAMAVATRTLTDVGLDRVADHERRLTRYAIDRLAGVPGLSIHGPTDTTGPNDKVGVIPFTIAGIDHGLVAAVLGYEHGVGVRSGCFCAHPYIARLLQVDHAESTAWVERVSRGDKRDVPGMVRISFGCYNDRSDVDRAVHAIERVVAGDHSTDYRADLDGSFHPAGYDEPLLFTLDR
jgi:cysteine desulfurase/selenocysteine lyase